MEYLTYRIFKKEIIKHLQVLNLPIPEMSLDESNENMFTLLYDIHTFGYHTDKHVRAMWRDKYHIAFDGAKLSNNS